MTSAQNTPDTVFDRRMLPSMDLTKVEQAEKLLGVGRFEISALIQKRVQELIRGAPPLVRVKSDNPIEIALAEVLQGLVTLERGSDEDILSDEGFSLGEGEGDEEPEAIDSPL
jgi:DNA-directed RNA polymerase subunit K/omega